MPHRDLSFCTRPFPPGSRGLEAHDPRFLHVNDLVGAGKHAEAADAIEALAREGILDPRLLSHLLLQAFREDGFARLGELVDAVSALTARDWSPVLPAERAPLYLNKAWSALVQGMLDAAEYHQAKNDETWRRWTQGVEVSHVSSAIERATALLKALPSPTFDASGTNLANLVRWMRELQPAIAHAAAQAEEAATRAAASPEKRPASATRPAASPEGQDGVLPRAPGEQVTLRASAPFVELCRKLEAFARLVEQRDFERAAFVAEDLQTLTASFDPRRYFPELFATFGALTHRHIHELKGHWDRKGTVEWRALEQFYQVDLEAFSAPRDGDGKR